MILADKVALITGAATGIRRDRAQLFAQEGAKIAIADIKGKETQETVQMIQKAGGDAFCIHADLSRMNNVEIMVSKAAECWRKLAIFFHNAGIAGPGFLDRTSEEEYDGIMAINLKAGFFGAKYAARELRKAGGGNILFTGSGAGIRPSPASPTYFVSKAGLIMLTRCLAYDLAKDNVRVNSICPGIVETPLWPAFMSRNPEMKPEILENIMLSAARSNASACRKKWPRPPCSWFRRRLSGSPGWLFRSMARVRQAEGFHSAFPILYLKGEI